MAGAFFGGNGLSHVTGSSKFNQFQLIYYVTHRDGRTERLIHKFSLRYLFKFEAEHLLARSGFEVEHLYAA